MIRYANMNDFEVLKQYEHGVSEEELRNCIESGRILVMFRRTHLPAGCGTICSGTAFLL